MKKLLFCGVLGLFLTSCFDYAPVNNNYPPTKEEIKKENPTLTEEQIQEIIDQYKEQE